MKVWTKVKIQDKNPQVDLISKSFINYLYEFGPILDLCRKYQISPDDRRVLEQYTANRISGLLLLYLSNDIRRINDIANKYNVRSSTNLEIVPEIEGYVDR